MKKLGIWIIIIICVMLLVLLGYFVVNEECVAKTYILKGVNGMTDENSGLLSSGDVSSTSLLMTDGTIITLDYRIKELKLNQQITIQKCKSMGTTFYVESKTK